MATGSREAASDQLDVEPGAPRHSPPRSEQPRLQGLVDVLTSLDLGIEVLVLGLLQVLERRVDHDVTGGVLAEALGLGAGVLQPGCVHDGSRLRARLAWRCLRLPMTGLRETLWKSPAGFGVGGLLPLCASSSADGAGPLSFTLLPSSWCSLQPSPPQSPPGRSSRMSLTRVPSSQGPWSQGPQALVRCSQSPPSQGRCLRAVLSGAAGSGAMLSEPRAQGRRSPAPSTQGPWSRAPSA
jgi:hypothetical protein